MSNQNQLESLLKKINLYNSETIQKLKIYIKNLKKWNQVINLTSKNFDITRHIEDSMMFFEAFKQPAGKLLDIGSGNGFPSIVIAIVCPNLHITMVESNTKKCAFLRDVCMKLSLNAKVLNENILKLQTQDIFDLVTMRGLKISRAIETKIYTLLRNNSGNLLIWANPSPLLKKFDLIKSVSKDNKYLHIYIKAQVAQQPR